MRIHAFAARAPGLRCSHSTMSFTNWPVRRPMSKVTTAVSATATFTSSITTGVSRITPRARTRIVGTVAATGEAVEQLNIGERVGVGWQSGSCLRCEWCLNGYENLCRSKVLTCVRRMVDSPISFALTVVLPSPSGVARFGGRSTAPVRRRYSVRADAALRLRPHHHVGVVGIGGLGHLALQFAHAMGCEVTAFSTNPEKRTTQPPLGRSFCNEPRPVANAKRCPDPRFHYYRRPLPRSRGPLMWRRCGQWPLTSVSRLSSEAEAGSSAHLLRFSLPAKNRSPGA